MRVPDSSIRRGRRRRCSCTCSAQGGFTLIEIIAVMVILGVMAAVAVPRFVALEDRARMRSIDYGVTEMNSRESLTWAQVKLSDSGWLNDDPQVWSRVDTDLGAGYDWTAGPTAAGGTLRSATTQAALVRTASTTATAARWKR